MLAGVAGALLPAFGWLPAIGAERLGLHVWREMLATPGVLRGLALALSTGLVATALSALAALLIVAAWRGTRAFRLIERALSPLLATPHAAAAFGLAFLLAPSGWLVRAVSPWATGWDAPPDWLFPNDPWGLALTLGLIAKETPFLLLMTLSALSQVDAGRAVLAGRAAGHGRVAAFAAGVLPRIWPQLRLPALAVLAYSVSVVDMALILGPTTPPTLSVQVLRWSGDPDLALRLRAGAGAALLLLATLAAAGLWLLGERLLAALGRRWLESGLRLRGDRAARALGLGLAVAVSGAVFAGLAAMAVWSAAGFWSFPDALPDGWSARAWARASDGLVGAAAQTLLIGAAATLVGLALALACLEAEHRHGLRPTTRALWLMYLPLVVPQASFLFGLQTLGLSLGVGLSHGVVIAAHVLFVTPYVFLSLGPAFRAVDPALLLSARALGAGPDRVLWAVRLPVLLRPLLGAAAVGFAVSAAQYLPTLMLGGGRIETLTTEAVALSAGGDRRAIGVWAVAQALAPALGFALALAVPRLAHRNRRGLAP